MALAAALPTFGRKERNDGQSEQGAARVFCGHAVSTRWGRCQGAAVVWLPAYDPRWCGFARELLPCG